MNINIKPTYQQLEKENEELRKELSDKRKDEYFRELMINNTEALTVIDIEGNNVFQSSSAKNILGYNRKERLGKSAFEYIIDEDREKLLKRFNTNKKKQVTSERISFRAYHKDGSLRYFEGTVKNMLHSPIVNGVIINFRDITERVKAQKALEEKEEILRTLINSTPDIICFKDGEGRWLEANDADLELFQLKNINYRGKKDSGLAKYSVFYYDAFMSCEASDEITWKKGTISRADEIIPKPDGSTKIYDVIKVPIFNEDGSRKGLVVLGRDITKMRQVEKELKNQIAEYELLTKEYKKQNNELEIAKEKAEESNKLKSAFLANMSHEIRTPLNSILGLSSILKSPQLEIQKRNRFIDIIEKSGHHLLNLINDIIDISKIDAGQITLIEKECELNNLMLEIYQIYHSEIVQKNKQINISVSKDLLDGLDVIKIDETRLRQILLNLVGNAVKFTKKGSVEIKYIITNDNKIQFSVKDTGIGISKKELPIIFERFRQADGTLTRKYGGTGLGLAISKASVELLGGKIWVESAINKGSTFYFTIPYEPIHKPVTKETNKIELKEESFNEKTILIVEDDPFSFVILEEIILPTKANILKATNGLQAIDFCKRNTEIDLVLMDIQLPELDGLKATKEILKFRPNLPIISQTANAMQNDKIASLKAGCVDYITKPIKSDNLISLIAKYIK